MKWLEGITKWLSYAGDVLKCLAKVVEVLRDNWPKWPSDSSIDKVAQTKDVPDIRPADGSTSDKVSLVP